MNWHDSTLAVLDLEATGVDPSSARIIEVALFRFENNGSSLCLVNELVDPGVALPVEVTSLTGITQVDLATKGSDPATVVATTRDSIASLVEDETPIVVYNARYDWPLLAAELSRNDLGALPSVPPATIIDPLVLDRKLDRYRKGKRTLSDVAAHYGVRVNGAHRAAQDAAATVAVARELARRYPQLQQMSGSEVVGFQAAAFREWKQSLNEHLRRINASRHPVMGDWPM